MEARPRLRLGSCSLSVYTVVGSGKTLYVKFLSTFSVTFFEGKKGGGLARQLFFHVSLASDHPKVMTDNLVCTATKERHLTRGQNS